MEKSYKEILLFIIDKHTLTYHRNKIIAQKVYKKYNLGIKLTTIAMLISILLLLTNLFIKIDKIPLKIPLTISDESIISYNEKRPGYFV